MEREKPKKKRKHLSKFALLQCLERYFKDDHDEALALLEFIWKEKDKLTTIIAHVVHHSLTTNLLTIDKTSIL